MKETICLVRSTIFLMVLLFLGACSHPVDETWFNTKSPKSHSSSRLNCKMCHDLTIECNGCHFGESGSKTPSDWTHGTTPHDQLEADGDVCNTCHALSRSYGNGPPACHDCHALQDNPGMHVTGEPCLNKTSPDFHGSSTLNCADCHDLSTRCADCHFGESGSKTPSDWVHGMTSHDQLEADRAVCNTCHDLNRSYGNGPTICHDCHGLPANHVKGEAWINKTSPDFHGSSTLTCADCHDLGTECVECHFDVTGSKSTSEWTHGTDPHDQLEVDGPVCNTCHDLNRGYGNGPESCHDCHDHVAGEAWINKTSPDFHGSSTLTCADCHDLGTECVECHFDATGSKSTSEWTHGTDPHDQLEADGPVCNTCHELNRGYGNGPESCHDCHDFPEHVTGEAWLNRTSPDYHGSSTLNCVDCHDLSLECTECHFDATGGNSPSDWNHGTTPHDQLEVNGPVCNTCHELNRGYGNGPESCHDCHALNTHAVPFSDHELQARNDPASCQECHGADLNGGSGPACSECHTADSPLTALNCTSCHDKPPAGADYPNTNGAHTVHNLLAGVTGACTICHQGAGTQTAAHYDAVVEVTFSGYNANSGTASYDAGSDTCSQVSCHGGKNTRPWFSGSINVNTECNACHSSGGEYNSYVSGEHDKHVRGEGHPCTECHDTSKLQTVHFNDLGTPQMNQAAQTIRDELNYNGQYCLFTCHFGNEDKQHDEEKRW